MAHSLWPFASSSSDSVAMNPPEIGRDNCQQRVEPDVVTEERCEAEQGVRLRDKAGNSEHKVDDRHASGVDFRRSHRARGYKTPDAEGKVHGVVQYVDREES